MDRRNILIVLAITILSLGLIGISYAFYQARIDYENAENIIISSGNLELELKDTTEVINIPNARPGDSDSKKFTVENHGNETFYNIKFTSITNTFVGDDLKYTLTRTDGVDEAPVTGFINDDTIKTDAQGNKYLYLKTNISIDAKEGDVIPTHSYTLKLEFVDKPEVSQNDNQGATFIGKINIDQEEVDENGEVVVPSEPLTATFIAKLEEAEKTGNAMYDGATRTLDDGSEQEDNNLRYIGANPNNYIWFNCNDYNFKEPTGDDDTYEKQASGKQCELWRIIGLFNNMTTVDENGTETTGQSLVKIIRLDSIGKIKWDDNNTNNWTNATLQETLNNESTGYISSSYSGDVKGITADTKGMVEKVEWNIGGVDSTTKTVMDFYEKERSNTAYNKQPTTWNGKVGLIYASDYGYATAGETNKTRQECLNYQLFTWNSGDYLTDCANTDWLKSSSGWLWTLTTYFSTSSNVIDMHDAGLINTASASTAYAVRPSLYLTSKVGIKEGVGTGEATDPYILEVAE